MKRNRAMKWHPPNVLKFNIECTEKKFFVLFLKIIMLLFHFFYEGVFFMLLLLFAMGLSVVGFFCYEKASHHDEKQKPIVCDNDYRINQ